MGAGGSVGEVYPKGSTLPKTNLKGILLTFVKSFIVPVHGSTQLNGHDLFQKQLMFTSGVCSKPFLVVKTL
jgi:hypothetical protein